MQNLFLEEAGIKLFTVKNNIEQPIVSIVCANSLFKQSLVQNIITAIKKFNVKIIYAETTQAVRSDYSIYFSDQGTTEINADKVFLKVNTKQLANSVQLKKQLWETLKQWFVNE